MFSSTMSPCAKHRFSPVTSSESARTPFDAKAVSNPMGSGEHHRASRGSSTPDDSIHVPLDTRLTTVLGSRDDCDVKMAGGNVSPAHAVIFEMHGRRYIRDLRSISGTFVNSRKVGQSELHADDEIQVGESKPTDAAAPSHDPDGTSPACSPKRSHCRSLKKSLLPPNHRRYLKKSPSPSATKNHGDRPRTAGSRTHGLPCIGRRSAGFAADAATKAQNVKTRVFPIRRLGDPADGGFGRPSVVGASSPSNSTQSPNLSPRRPSPPGLPIRRSSHCWMNLNLLPALRVNLPRFPIFRRPPNR